MEFKQSRSLAVTDEEGDLLYALVRMAKPQRCLETGTGYGVAARRIGEALAANGGGVLETCELEEDRIAEATERVAGLPVVLYRMRGEDLIVARQEIDFILVDSGEPDVRLRELRLLNDWRVTPGGVVVVHDVLNQEQYDYTVLLAEFAERGWPCLVLPSLAGIAVYRRPS